LLAVSCGAAQLVGIAQPRCSTRLYPTLNM
jgi:hypothetical protein